MAKILLLAAAALALYVLLRRRFPGLKGDERKVSGKGVATLVRCPVCGVYFEEGTGFASKKGFVCSEACRSKADA